MTTFVEQLHNNTELVKAGRGKTVNTLICFGQF